MSAAQPDWSVTHLRRIALGCSAFDECVDYYAGPWGLQRLGDSDDQMALLRATGSEHHVLELHRSDKNRIDHIGLGLADERAVDAAADGLASLGVTVLDEPAELGRPGGGYGFRIADPEGRVVELSADTESLPAMPAGPTPAKISHVVLNTADISSLRAWWCDVLGFRVSDWSEEQMVFLRCNTDHHSIAFNRAEWASLNHVAYEVNSLDAYMSSLGRLNRAGYTVGWGPGRHGPGNNAFGYFVDPAGMVPEVTAEVQQVDEATWVPRVWPRTPELSDRWGTAGPPSAEMRQHMAGAPEA